MLPIKDGYISIHPELGSIENSNFKLQNQANLGVLFPDFIPQVVLPNSDVLASIRESNSFPVVHVEGETFLSYYERAQPSFTEVLTVGIEYYKQQLRMLRRVGVMLRDRKADNMILEKVSIQDDSSIRLGNQQFHLWQVDLDYVSDEVDGVWLENNADSLVERAKTEIVFQDPLDTYKKLANELACILRLFDLEWGQASAMDRQRYSAFVAYFKDEFQYIREDWSKVEQKLSELSRSQGTALVLNKLDKLVAFSEKLVA